MRFSYKTNKSRLKLLFIFISCNLAFFYFRFIYLQFDVSNSYVYYLIPNYNPNRYALKTIVLYTIILSLLMISISFFYYFINLKKRFRFNISIKELSFLKIMFYVSVCFQIYRTVILGTFAGNSSSSSFFRIFFFIQWLFSYKLLGFFLFTVTRKYRYLITIAILIIISGMKSGVFLIILFLFFTYYITNDYRKKDIRVLLWMIIIAIGSFPVLIYSVGVIRSSGEISFSLFWDSIVILRTNYFSSLFDAIRFILKRLNYYEFFHTIILLEKNIERDSLNSLLSIVHIYNEFVPSFMESQYFYQSRSMNALYPVIFFDQDIRTISTEALTIPGQLVLYHGYWLACIYSLLLGSIIGLQLNYIENIYDNNLRVFITVYFYVFLFGFIQSGSIPSMILFYKEIISLVILLLLFKMLRKILSRSLV